MLIENLFLNMFQNKEVFQVVLPHLEDRYFKDTCHRIIYKKINDYYSKFDKQPSISDIKLLLEGDNSISEKDTESCYEFFDKIKNVDKVTDKKLLIDQIQEFCQQRALELAILDSVEVLQDPKANRGSIEEKIKKALSVEFDVKIGDDYFSDVIKRFKEYLETEDKIPLDIENINLALGGGLVKKAIFFFMANTGVGKSIFLAHSACSLVKSGHNILYLSGELSCREVQKRLDANLLEMPINSFNNHDLDKALFKSKFKSLIEKSHGEMIVKYCPAGTVNSLHIKNIIHEIKLKKGYLPDILILDHLTLFGSCRLPSSQSGTHLYIRSVVEEIRSIAIEYNCVILTACQLTRGAKSKDSDVSNEDVALAYAISETSDWSSAIIQTSELKEQNRFLLKVMKSRFASNTERIYNLGINYEYMRLLNVEEAEAVPLHIQDALKNSTKNRDANEENIIHQSFDFN